MGGEDERLLQLHQRQVKLVREEVILGMYDLPGYGTLRVRQLFLHVREVVLANPYSDLGRQQAKWILKRENERERKMNVNRYRLPVPYEHTHNAN